MSQIRLKETVTTLKLIIPEPSGSHLESPQTRDARHSPLNADDLVPYSSKELKYLWTRWDEAQRCYQSGRRYRYIYVGAVGVILTGWLMQGLSFSPPVGGILMLVGSLIGIWFCLKARRHHKDSAMGDKGLALPSKPHFPASSPPSEKIGLALRQASGCAGERPAGPAAVHLRLTTAPFSLPEPPPFI